MIPITKTSQIMNTQKLIEDLQNELQHYSEQIAQILPEKIKNYKDYWLSTIWGYSKKYVNTLRKELEKNPNKQINKIAINKLNLILETELGEKFSCCKSLFKLYQENKITGTEFLNRLRNELGRVSGQIPITLEELGYILIGSTRFIPYVWDKINYPIRKNYNLNYKFSIERLTQFKDNLNIIFGENAQESIKMIERYKKANPDLKEYKNQQYKVQNPHIFEELNTVEKLYWFGFLCADGWFIEKTQRLGFELAKKDRERLEKYVKFIGLPLDRIKERTRFIKHKSGKISSHNMCSVLFICKPIIHKLLEYGFRETTSKTEPKLKQVPPIITNLISQAKIEALQGKFVPDNINLKKINKLKQWYYTKSGRLALAWLLGFYDGDGHHMGGRSASIASSSVSFLKQIQKLFMARNRVREYKFPSLSLGPDLFDAMMYCFRYSMVRKRFEIINDN